MIWRISSSCGCWKISGDKLQIGDWEKSVDIGLYFEEVIEGDALVVDGDDDIVIVEERDDWFHGVFLNETKL